MTNEIYIQNFYKKKSEFDQKRKFKLNVHHRDHSSTSVILYLNPPAQKLKKFSCTSDYFEILTYFLSFLKILERSLPYWLSLLEFYLKFRFLALLRFVKRQNVIRCFRHGCLPLSILISLIANHRYFTIRFKIICFNIKLFICKN